ncbi:pyruvate kinase, partial [Methylobacterium radiotolerans]
MLSAESASGQYPIEAVAMMDRIAREAEASEHYALMQRSCYDGTDAVMLSAESASGQYPIEAVAMMDRIAREA